MRVSDDVAVICYDNDMLVFDIVEHQHGSGARVHKDRVTILDQAGSILCNRFLLRAVDTCLWVAADRRIFFLQRTRNKLRTSMKTCDELLALEFLQVTPNCRCGDTKFLGSTFYLDGLFALQEL